MESIELFRISKSENSNVVIYAAVPSSKNPTKPKKIISYWILNEKGGKEESLNWIEKKMSYGFKKYEKASDSIMFAIAGLPNFEITVRFDGEQFRAFGTIDGRDSVLTGVFIDVTTVVLLKPTIRSLTLTGIALDNQDEVREVIAKQ